MTSRRPDNQRMPTVVASVAVFYNVQRTIYDVRKRNVIILREEKGDIF